MTNLYLCAANAKEILLGILFAVVIVAFAYWLAYLIWYCVYKIRAGKAAKRPPYVDSDNMRNFNRFNAVTARKQLPRKQRKYVDKVFIVNALKRPPRALPVIFFAAGFVLEIGCIACMYVIANSLGATAVADGWTAYNILSIIALFGSTLAGALSVYYYSLDIMYKSFELPKVRMTMPRYVYQSAAYIDVKTAVPEPAALAALGIERSDIVDCGAYDFTCRETDAPALIACDEDMKDFRSSAYTAVYAFCTPDEVCVYTRRHDVVYGTTDAPNIIREKYSDINAVTLTQEYRDVKLERGLTIPRNVTRITLDCKDGTKYFEFDVLNPPTEALAGMLCKRIDELRADFAPASSADSISGE